MSLEKRLESFLGQWRVSFRSGKQSFIMDCLNPACGKQDHMYVRKRDGASRCFKCGKSWGWRALTVAIAKCAYADAYSVFWGVDAGERITEALDLDLMSPEILESSISRNPPIILGADFVDVTRSQIGMDYLSQRGVSPSIVRDYDIRYQGIMNAVVFPIKFGGIVYGWQARFIEPENPKMRMISSSFNKSQFLLNYDRASSRHRMILVEGPFDCVHCDISGVGAVASLGKGISQDQIELILESKCEELYLGLDPDASEEIYEVVGRIGLEKKIFRLSPPLHREDFGECSEDEVKQAIRFAIPMAGAVDLLEVHLKT